MGYSQKLIDANENLIIAYEKGTDSPEYKMANAEWFKVFTEVAQEEMDHDACGSVISWENPTDSIMEAIFDNAEPEWIESMLIDFGKMVDCLESIGHLSAGQWRTEYEHCKEEYNK